MVVTEGGKQTLGGLASWSPPATDVPRPEWECGRETNMEGTHVSGEPPRFSGAECRPGVDAR